MGRDAAILDSDIMVIIAPQRLAVDALRHLASGVPVVAVEGSVDRDQRRGGGPTWVGSPNLGRGVAA
ncbi:hypothetical protein BE17_14680 [Sorangium cellulosum]|uniref:Uncharacterized protein n=1 Tax=Sorangium cellulosum TaxID=56 RepID=A0A150RVX1_SORCE|nr:hypothetical protein BE17_14680 [Sorangium cellulosum]